MKDELEKLKRVKIKKRKRSSITEAVGNTEAVRSFHHYGFGAYKISDVQGSRFTETKPCDILVCSPKGRYIAVEGKMIKKWCSFGGNVLRPNQIFELEGTSIKRKGRAFIFLYVRIPPNKIKGTKRVHKLVVFDWAKYRKIFMGRGISIEDMRNKKYGVWIDPFKRPDGKIIYDIRKIFKGNKK